jgi:hypothetical protein
VSAHAGADTNTGEFAAYRLSGAAFEAWGKNGNRERWRHLPVARDRLNGVGIARINEIEIVAFALQ